jgi:Cu-Zn family superoxide dismutase
MLTTRKCRQIANRKPSCEGTTTLAVVAKRMLLMSIVGLLALVAGTFNSQSGSVLAAPNHDHADGKAHGSEVDKAVCVIVPVGDSGVSGVLRLTKSGDVIQIRGEIKGLTPGKHGFHIHEFGDLTDTKTGKSAGGHFNPEEQPHGAHDAEHRHVGDLGNIVAGKDGTAVVDIRDSLIKFSGKNSVIGRSFLVHADEDVFTQPVGGAGARVGFGVIGIAGGE